MNIKFRLGKLNIFNVPKNSKVSKTNPYMDKVERKTKEKVLNLEYTNMQKFR